MSPDYRDYRLRSFSINSLGWNHHRPSFDYRGRFSIDECSEAKADQQVQLNQETTRKLSALPGGDSKNEMLNILMKREFKPNPIGRKNTIIDNPSSTLKQPSPSQFPKFCAAFRPFKKRAQSFHISPQLTNLVNGDEKNGHDNNSGEMEENGVVRKRDLKAELKEK